MSKVKFSAIRGMNDLLPDDAPAWEQFERTAVSVLRAYGFRQIRTPILETTGLFARGVGEVTDIVEKEMYSFVDSLNGEQMTLRPEGTSAVVRSVIEHSLAYSAPQRLWYMGPMFRHERPQKGRYRQFHQLGCEAIGFKGPDVDAELLLMLSRLWQELGIDGVKLELNSLGAGQERARHREALIAYFEGHRDALDEDALRRLHTNPLRILDTKNPDMQELVAAAPKLLDFLGEESRAFLAQLERYLEVNGISYEVNPRLVRGLDYYNHTVFEWTTDKLGAQSTICGGGRYDPLVEMLGGRPTPACGFAIGIERAIEVMAQCGVHPTDTQCDAYVLHQGGRTQEAALQIAENLRDDMVRTIVHSGSLSMKNQMRRADASGAEFAVIVGEGEYERGCAAIKRLRDRGEGAAFSAQQEIALDKVAGTIADLLMEDCMRQIEE